MPLETETRTGRCASHGTVDATRDMPKSGFPWIINALRRLIAGRRPFRCPICDAPVETS
jgi:hypothetical protein